MIAPTEWAVVALTTVGCALTAVILGGVLVRAMRHRSVIAHLVVASLAALLTVAASVAETMQAMFLSSHDSRVVLVVIALSVNRRISWCGTR